MPSFDLKVSINVSEKEAEELLKKYGYKASLYAQWSYAGTMVPCEDLEDFHRLETDQEYAEERIIQTTTIM